MTTPEPRTRRCDGCGYRVIPDGPDDRFCSATCAGSVSMAAVVAGLRRFAEGGSARG